MHRLAKSSKFLIVFAATVLAQSVSLAAAPSCSNVFKDLNPEKIASTIENLARLKMELDIAKINTQSTVTHALMPMYVSKLIDLKRNLKGEVTESEIRDMIQKKIRELQGLEELKSEKIAEQKAEIRNILRANEARESYYVMNENPHEFKEDFHFYAGQKMYVMHDGNLLYITPEGGLHIYNPAKTKNADLDLNLNARIYNTDGKIIYGMLSDYFYTYDSIQARVKKFELHNFVGEFNMISLDISPNKNLAILTGQSKDRNQDEFSIVDIAAQKEIFTNHDFSGHVNEMLFLDDGHVIAIVNGNELHKIDITAKKTIEKVELQIDTPQDLTLSKDRTHVSVFGSDIIKSFKVDDLQTPIAAKAMLKDVDSGFYIPTQVMPSNYHELLGYTMKNGVRVMNLDKLDTVFDFGGRYTRSNTNSTRVFAIAVSHDKSKIFILYTPNASRIYIDTWDLYLK